MPITLYLQRQVPGQIWAASRSLLTPELGHELCWSLDLWGPGTKKLFRSLEHSRLVAPETAQHAGSSLHLFGEADRWGLGKGSLSLRPPAMLSYRKVGEGGEGISPSPLAFWATRPAGGW